MRKKSRIATRRTAMLTAVPIPALSLLFLFTSIRTAHAGVFDLPAFLPEGKFSIGIEPEIITSNPSGAGINIKPKFGSSQVLNWQGIIGFGSGDRGMRLGCTADFDWFPDVDNQPGIATPFTLLYQRIDDDGTISYFFSPMLYKSFNGGNKDVGAVYTPFVSIPFGWQLRNSKNAGFSQIAFGSMFASPGAQNFKFTIEAGFEIKKSFSYLSGGVTWLP